MKTALLQLTSSDDPDENIATVVAMLETAACDGARFALTPEVTNCLSTSRSHQADVLRHEGEDPCLAAICDTAKRLRIHVLIGSLALKTNDADGRFANRSFLVDPAGQIVARYDKIHMFDVEIDATESYRESSGYRPGTGATLARTDFGAIGMCICYDLRFPHLSGALAAAGAEILTYPAAFSPVTGAAHWESLLRARAIETGCWVIAPAQTGTHSAQKGKPRRTHGHSLVVDPWGTVVLDAGTSPGVYTFDLEHEKIVEARKRIPSLLNRRDFDGP